MDQIPGPPAARAVAEPRRRESWRLASWLLLLFAASLLLNTRHNDFPYLYHPDEPGKVEQVMRGDWNFNHPLLLLSATRLAGTAIGAQTAQEVAEAGRWVSASFVALAVAALSLVGYQWRKWPGAIAVGILLLIHHQFFELSHYMKEDTALLMGLSLSFVGINLVWKRPSVANIVFLGAACGLALSGKYLGVCAIAVALPVFFFRRAPERAGNVVARLGLFFGSMLLLFLALNYPLITQWTTFETSLDREVGLVVKGHGGLTRRVPHSEYLNIFVDNTTPVIWALVGFSLVHWWKRRRDVPLPQSILTILPFVYMAALSCSPKSNDRYFLPVTALFMVLAGVGAVDVSRRFQERVSHRTGLTLLLILACAFEIPRLWRYNRAFQIDDRAELIAWIAGNIPKDAIIVQDGRVKIAEAARLGRETAGAGLLLPQKIIGRKLAADLGPFEQLRAEGVTHIAVSQSDYGGFFRKTHAPQRGRETAFQQQKDWYERLFKEGELLWERPRGTVIYLHPGIRVYRLPPE